MLYSNHPSGFFYTDCRDDAGDLRFTDEFTNKLSHEIDVWDNTNNSYAWVRVSNFTANTTLLMWWGNSTASAPAYATDGTTWTNNDFRSVWHLQEQPAPFYDATQSGCNGSDNGTSRTNGVIGRARFFDGVLRDDISILKEPAFDFETNQQFGISVWANSASASDKELRILSKRSRTSPFTGYETACASDGSYSFTLCKWSISNALMVVGGTTSRDGNWHHVEWTYDGSSSADGVKLYLDGTLTPLTVSWNSLTSSILNNIALRIGQRDSEDYFSYHGGLDEVRMSMVPRTSNWAWSAYASMKWPETFVNGSDRQMVLPIPMITNYPGISCANELEMLAGGHLLWTGTAPSTVWFYLGDNDAMEDKLAWNYNTNLGPGAVGPLLQDIFVPSYDTVYYYRYYATNDNGHTWGSPSGVWISGFGMTKSPANLAVSDVNGDRVLLTWEDRSQNESGFSVEQSTNGTIWSLVASAGKDAPQYTVTSLTTNTLYWFRVAATNAYQTSLYITATATTAEALLTPQNLVWDNGESADKNWTSRANWLPDADFGHPCYLDSISFTNLAVTANRYVPSTAMNQNLSVQSVTVHNTTNLHTLEVVSAKALKITDLLSVGKNAAGSRLSLVGAGTIQAKNTVVGLAGTVTGSGTLDFTSGAVSLNTGTLDIGAAANSYGAVRMNSGKITCGNLNAGISASTGRGYIQTSNSVITVTNRANFAAYGRMTNYVAGISSGLDLAFTDTSSAIITNMYIYFFEANTTEAMVWGIRMKGDQINFFNSLTNSGCVRYDASNLSPQNRQRLRVFYDPSRNQTMLGLQVAGTVVRFQ